MNQRYCFQRKNHVVITLIFKLENKNKNKNFDFKLLASAPSTLPTIVLEDAPWRLIVVWFFTKGLLKDLEVALVVLLLRRL